MIKRTLLLIAAFLVVSIPAMAQFEIGASYELRDESPKNGFGVRVQTGILQGLPLIKLGLRGHFSYFSEENTISSTGGSYSKEIENYDFGLAAIGGISLGLMEPYVGVGLGSENVDLKHKDFQGVTVTPQDDEESSIYWNTFVGAKVSILPILKPFVEYRFTGHTLEMPSMSDRTGRIIFGIALSF